MRNDTISYRFWIQTSVEEADEGTKIGEMKARNNPPVSGARFGDLPCRDLILDDKYMVNGNPRFDVHYVDGSNVQQVLTLGYFPNKKKVRLVLAGSNKNLNVLSGTPGSTSCSAT